jgi:hypothetical protein
MTDHFREAEKLLDTASAKEMGDWKLYWIARAQVHATLALAAPSEARIRELEDELRDAQCRLGALEDRAHDHTGEAQ